MITVVLAEGTVLAGGQVAEFSRESGFHLLIDGLGDEDIHQALEAGAGGYLFKSVVEDELIDAVREMHGGGRSLPGSGVTRLHEHEPGAG